MQATPHPLADEALARLRKLAEGNGLPPESIKVLEAEEQTITLKGLMKLEPVVEQSVQYYPGGPRAKGTQASQNSATLKSDTESKSDEMRRKPEWVAAAINRLNEQPGEGWGLDDARIDVPGMVAVLATTALCQQCNGNASVPCGGCHGQANIACNICRGARYEVCYACGGHGQVQGQPCSMCASSAYLVNGMRCVPCRMCQSRGTVACPDCHGRGGVPCVTCKATGKVTEEITLTLSVRTHFTLDAEGAPTNLRRGLDRLGAANLSKGHADIKVIEPPKEVEPDLPLPVELPPGMEQKLAKPARAEAPTVPDIHYQATMPYADMRMDFDGKKSIVSVFGKRKTLIGVPAFLDAALEPARKKLAAAAARGEGDTDALVSARVLRDALALQLGGKADVKTLRRIYPYGLSQQTALEILRNTRLALNKLTLSTRRAVAVTGAIFNSTIFLAIDLTPLGALWDRIRPGPWGDFILLALTLALGWLALATSTSFGLKRRFPTLKISLLQKTGKTGWATMAVVTAVFFAAAFFAPDRPEWMAALLRLFH